MGASSEQTALEQGERGSAALGQTELGRTEREQAALLQREWETDPRWAGITRDYTALDVIRLRARLAGREHSLVREARSLAGGDSGLAGAEHGVADDERSVADEEHRLGGEEHRLADGERNVAAEEHGVARRGASRLWDLLHGQAAVRDRAPVTADDEVVADADAAAGAGLDGSAAADAFGLMTTMIEQGAAGARFLDQVTDNDGGPVLIPTGQHIETLTAARLAADVLGVPALLIAQTGAHAASLLTSDADEQDHEFLTGERTADGHYRFEPGRYARVTRALAFAPYADVLCLHTSTPDLAEARAFAAIIYSQHPGKLLAYSCAAPLNWRARQDDASIAAFQRQLTALGYRFQFTTADAYQAPAPGEPTSALADAPDEMPAYA